MVYEDRLVAFIDILGFRNLVNGTVKKDGSENEDAVDAIYDAFETIEENWRDENLNSGTKRVTIFSDSIVVSVKIDEESQIFWTLLELKQMIMSLVMKGILVRGAVVRGKLLHEGAKVFGPALIEAYTLESKAAHYPRIILDRELIVEAGNWPAIQHDAGTEKKYVRSLLEQDSDGMYYIDYFFKASEELDEPEIAFPGYINKLAEIIRKGLMGSVHPNNADLRIKFFWMRERYNKMVEEVRKGMSVSAENLELPNELVELYSNLRKISPNRK